MTSQTPRKKITVLISGSGTNLQALIDASLFSPSDPSNLDSKRPLSGGQITHVISDRKDAYGLTRAREAGIATSYHGILPYKKRFPDESGTGEFRRAREAYDADLAVLVLRGGPNDASNPGNEVPEQDLPDLVVCAGFMRILTPAFLDPVHVAGVPIVNLHPSLHGDLVGAHCIERAWEEFREGKRMSTGVMVHFVIAAVDMGALIVQTEVGIEGCADLPDLQAKMHTAEHPLIVEGARRVLSGEAKDE